MSLELGIWGRTWVPLVIASSMLSACGGPAKLPASQVVAGVNKGEITVSQLNQALNSADLDTVTPQAAKSVIDSLVDEEILVQGALKQKLDRDPRTLQEIDSAKRQILAREFARRDLWPKDDISDKEEENYYKSNPALFENRKIYQMTVYTVSAAAMTDSLKEDLEKSHSPDQVRAALEKHLIRFETAQTSSPAEDLPMDQLSTFSNASAGDVVIMPRPNHSVSLVSIAAIELMPLGFERAKPAIEQYLTTSRNQKAVEDYLNRERSTSTITYGDTFAKYENSPVAGSKSNNSDERVVATGELTN